MANAKKCDRCKTCYDPLAQGSRKMVKFQNPVFQSSDDIRNAIVKERLINEHPDAWVDLCPECTKDFEAFMRGQTVPHDDEYAKRFKEHIIEEAYDIPSDYFRVLFVEVLSDIIGIPSKKKGENE